MTDRLSADLVSAAREALDAWCRMPDAIFAEDDPRYDWWYETADARDRLRSALAAVEDPLLGGSEAER